MRTLFAIIESCSQVFLFQNDFFNVWGEPTPFAQMSVILPENSILPISYTFEFLPDGTLTFGGTRHYNIVKALNEPICVNWGREGHYWLSYASIDEKKAREMWAVTRGLNRLSL